MKTRCLFIGGPVDGQWLETEDSLPEKIVHQHVPLSYEEEERLGTALGDAPVSTAKLATIPHMYFRERYRVSRGEIESVYIHKDTHMAMEVFRLLFDNYKPEKKE